MKAYVVSEVEVLDEKAASDYRRLAAASITDYGGRYHARGAKAEVVEGEPTERQIIIVEFSSLEQAREWYTSPAYAKALRFRERALDRRLMSVEGVAPTAV